MSGVDKKKLWKAQQIAINELYAHRCSHDHIVNEDFDNGKLPDLSDKLIEKIFTGDIAKEAIPEELYFETAKIMNEGVEEVMGNYSYDSGKNALASVMRSQIYAFSSAKNQTMALEMRDALIDDDGKVKAFSKFKVDAKQISGKYNENWLSAEYNTAISSAQMGRKWQEIEDAEDLYPYLIYRTVGDGRVSDEHAALNGLKLPVDDPKWNSIYPPNRFNCRCSVEQTDNGIGITSSTDVNARTKKAKIKKNFKRNTGKEGLQFLDETYKTRLIETDGKIEQLGAVKHYGMRTLSKIYAKGKKPTIKPVKDKIAFEEWFATQTKINPDTKGTGFIINDSNTKRKIHVPSSIRRKMPNKERLYANAMIDVVKEADEVWTLEQSAGRISTAYIRYYEDAVYYAIVDTEVKKNGLKLKTFLKAKTLNAAENLRRGILENKK